MTEKKKLDTEIRRMRKPKPPQKCAFVPAERMMDEFREPKDEADLLPIETVVEGITRKPQSETTDNAIQAHVSEGKPQNTAAQQMLRADGIRQAVETIRAEAERNKEGSALSLERNEPQKAFASYPAAAIREEPEKVQDAVPVMPSAEAATKTTQHFSLSHKEPIRERMKAQGIQTIVRKARSAMDKAQELGEQPVEDSPSEYAEQKVENYGMEAVRRVGSAAETIGTHVRQETVRHFSKKQEKDRIAEEEQAQPTMEDRNNVFQETNKEQRQEAAAKEPQPGEDTHIENPTKPNPRHEIQEEAERAPQKQKVRSTVEKEGGKPNAQGQTNGSSAQREEAKSGIPRSEFRRKDGIVSPAQRLVSGTEEKAHAAHTPNHTVMQPQHMIRTGQRAVKAAEETGMALQQTAKSTQQTAKTAQKAAQASAKAARIAKETSKRAAQATTKAGKALAAAIKAIIEAGKALVAAIMAGGWMAVLILVMIASIAFVLISSFGLFFSNDVSRGRPMTEAIQEINGDFVDSIHAQISRYTRQIKPDEVELVYEGDTGSDGSVMNWADVLGIYAVSTTTDPEQPTDVLIVTDEKEEILRLIFRQMNSVSYQTEVETEEVPAVDDTGKPIYDKEGKRVMEEKKTLTITIYVSSMDYREAAALYGFDTNQNEMLREMMRPEYYPLYAELTGDAIGDGGENGFGLDINPDLPPSELGYKIVQAAKRYIGRSYASMDCSKFARTAYADVGLTSMNGLSSVRMAEKCRDMGCLFTDPSQLQAGDLIFFARYDPSRGKDYCGDINRCGIGKCRRWLHIHHVAIYINDQYLIDSTGGDNSVQIRKLYGQNTARWKWVCFGRPTT